MTGIHTLKIEGMHCMNSCVRAVKEELGLLEEITIKTVVVNEATVEYDSEKVSPDQIKEAISEAGFRLVSIE
ncbi:MAG: cation transporter [Bacteroidetes bacterium]|nr:cation transporter [Bacteroidota bacterium]